MTTPASRQFRDAYAAHRAAEGRGAGGEAELLALPYLRTGPLARQWAVRARTFDRFRRVVVQSLVRERGHPLAIADLGAGNGWLSHRLARDGHRVVALDVRTDGVDGLGAATSAKGRFSRVAASFQHLPIAIQQFDLVVFNAALHYATDLARTLQEAARIAVPLGRIAILDSPFYRRPSDGEAMVAAKHRDGACTFGALAQDLLAAPCVEFLTPGMLASASASVGLVWRRHRVRYPLWYELRPAVAFFTRRRASSRFDVWSAVVP